MEISSWSSLDLLYSWPSSTRSWVRISDSSDSCKWNNSIGVFVLSICWIALSGRRLGCCYCWAATLKLAHGNVCNRNFEENDMQTMTNSHRHCHWTMNVNSHSTFNGWQTFQLHECPSADWLTMAGIHCSWWIYWVLLLPATDVSVIRSQWFPVSMHRWMDGLGVRRFSLR